MKSQDSAHVQRHAAPQPRDGLLRRIEEDVRLPTLGAAIGKVVEITSSDEDSVAELAHFVLADQALTQKILRLSNTIHYRSAGTAPVTTISRAIFLLGFNTIKTSALAMLLVDCFKDRNHAHSVRRELMQALCASVVARELMLKSRLYAGEEVAVAALFKNIGRVLVASFDHPLYQRITHLAESGQTNEREAAATLLGCSYERFAEQALTGWQIPDSIIHALTPPPPGDLKKAGERRDWQRQAVDFCSTLAEGLIKGGLPGLTQAAPTLLRRYGAALELDAARLSELITRVDQETRLLAKSMDISLPEVTSATEAPTTAHGLPQDALLTALDVSTMQQHECHPSGKPKNARDRLLAGVQDVTQMLAAEHFRLNDLILLVLETLYSSLGFRFATICLRDVQSGRFLARVSVGEDYAARQQGFFFSSKLEQDLFSLSMSNNVDLMISDASEAKIRALLPGWHVSLLPDARSFIVLPLVIQNKPLGFFYADRTQVAPEGVPADETALIKTLKGQLLAALLRT